MRENLCDTIGSYLFFISLKVRAAQLSTDRHGKAFIVFDDDVYHIEFELEPSNRKISDGLFWKPDHQYKLHRSHHKQTVYVETITKVRIKLYFFQCFKKPHNFLYGIFRYILTYVHT